MTRNGPYGHWRCSVTSMTLSRSSWSLAYLACDCAPRPGGGRLEAMPDPHDPAQGPESKLSQQALNWSPNLHCAAEDRDW